MLGDLALTQSDASHIESLANAIAGISGGTYGRLTLSSSTLACHIAGATPLDGSVTAHQALDGVAKAFVLVGCEPERDSARGAKALDTLRAADKVVCLTSYASDAMREYADVLLPITPFTETSGTYVSQDGTIQSFTGVVRPLGEARPGWKVLRVFGDLFGADFASLNSSEDVKALALSNYTESQLGARVRMLALSDSESKGTLERVADVPIYHADSLVRRGHALSLSAYGKQPRVRVSQKTADSLGLKAGADVRLTQGGYSANATLHVDSTVAEGAVRVPLSTEISAQLGDVVAAITLEAA